MASKKNPSKGKRYSAKQKQQVIDFVNQVNATKGRGGQAAASKKFGITPLTISAWLKKAGATTKVAAAVSRKAQAPSSSPRKQRTVAAKPSASASKRGKVLAELASVDQDIARHRKELEALEARFQKLKDQL